VTAVEVDNNGNGKRYFGCGNGNYENGKENPFKCIGIQVFIESNKVDIDAVQHELNAHQYSNHIPPGKQAIHAYKKQAGAYE
jgi:hypothetical protein